MTHAHRTGFTLVELLAVLVVIGLLIATLTTSVATTRPNGYGWQCLNNQRQLAMAWRMYADDNQGRLPPNRDGSVGFSAAQAAWVGGWLDFTSSSQNTNVDLLINHAKYPYAAYLGPYVHTASIFKCPADKSAVRIAGLLYPRVRSVSMNNYLGEGARTWSGTQARYRLYPQMSLIKSPADVFVFLDERQESINDPVFLTNPDVRYNMVDFPASYHAGAGAFSFADGHAEFHKWKDPRTAPALRPGTLMVLNVSLPGNEDVDWIQQKAVGARP